VGGKVFRGPNGRYLVAAKVCSVLAHVSEVEAHTNAAAYQPLPPSPSQGAWAGFIVHANKAHKTRSKELEVKRKRRDADFDTFCKESSFPAKLRVHFKKHQLLMSSGSCPVATHQCCYRSHYNHHYQDRCCPDTLNNYTTVQLTR
jgi:hypothetical protein